MSTYTFHIDDQNYITCTDPQGQPILLKDVPCHAVRDVLANMHGLINNGRWHTSV